MKNILITGANGYLAHQLINELLNHDCRITALSSNPEYALKSYNNHVEIISNEEVLSGQRNISDADVVIHTAFCRKSIGSQLYNSLIFMQNLVDICCKNNIKAFINISSQSVYSQQKTNLPDETGIIDPGYLYAFAKISSEMLLDQMSRKNKNMKYTNVRLAALIGPGNIIPNNVLSKFIVSALNGETFRVIGGKQNFSFLDVRDAAKAISLLALKNPEDWDICYNLGPEKQTNILDMAEIVCREVENMYEVSADFQFTPDDTYLNSGMNSEKLYTFINWRPNYSFSQIVKDTIDAKYKEIFEN